MKTLRILIILAMQAGGFLIAYRAADHQFLTYYETALYAFLLWIACAMLAVVIHELGHAAAAKAIGWRIHFISVSGFGYAPVARRWRRAASVLQQDIGGWVLATPPRGRDWSDGHGVLAAGGPLANAVTGGAALIAAAGFDRFTHAGSALEAFGLISILIAIANLIPVRTSEGGASDGALIWAVLKDGGPSETERAIAYSLAADFDGAGARHADDIAVIKESAESGDLAAAAILSGQYFSTGEIERARPLLERLIAADPKHYAICRPDLAFIIAMIDGDPQSARGVLNATDKTTQKLLKQMFSYWRADAAIEHLEGDHDAALAAIEKARKMMRREGAVLDDDEERLYAAIKEKAPLPVFGNGA